MGEVYRAADSKLGRDVALKVILQEFVQDTQLMARFQREAQVPASLNHMEAVCMSSFTGP